MFARTDLALYGRNDRLTAVAEIKNKPGTSREWAARTRRNILAHGGSCGADFFILVTPDRLYLWKDAGTDPVRIPPTYEADAQLEFAPYFESAGVDPHHVGGHAFELLVATLLESLRMQLDPKAGYTLEILLSIVGEYCRVGDLPPLNSIVVNQETGVPGNERRLQHRPSPSDSRKLSKV